MSIAAEHYARIESLIESCWPSARIDGIDQVQGLWNDFGAIVRVRLGSVIGAGVPGSVIAKVVEPPVVSDHPRGWNTDRSSARKLHSYQVEKHFYEHVVDAYLTEAAATARVPRCFATSAAEASVALLLEDLDGEYPMRASSLDVVSAGVCLDWLAAFHAHFMNRTEPDLWEEGCYWHLSTRTDEYAAMPDSELKAAAYRFDELLANCHYKTLVHGDAKVANFCFSADGGSVAAVDFQYIGAGCGMRDVAYFLGSCLDESVLAEHESELLDRYFAALESRLSQDHAAIETEWRALYPVAGADFHRFLVGWSPGHWKLTGYSMDLVTRALRYADGIS